MPESVVRRVPVTVADPLRDEEVTGVSNGAPDAVADRLAHDLAHRARHLAPDIPGSAMQRACAKERIDALLLVERHSTDAVVPAGRRLMSHERKFLLLKQDIVPDTM